MVKRLFVSLLFKEDGQDLIEYGLLGGFISVASVLSVQRIGPLVETYYHVIHKALSQ